MEMNIKEKLYKDIYNEIEFDNLEFESFSHYMDQYFEPRIKLLLDQAEEYVFERHYVETAWKEMISLHYINTTYKFHHSVARIHFFSEKGDEYSEDTYLGYITVRLIDEIRMILSYVVPNWLVLKCFDNKDTNLTKVMFYNKTVHFQNKKFVIKTFEFFAQDGVVASCVNADLLMFSNFLNKVYGLKSLKLSEMYEYPDFPNQGYDITELKYILKENKIPTHIYPLEEKTSDDDSYVDIKDLIKSYVSSNLPVILGFGSHVILVIGIRYKNGEDYDFVVYDDSGYYTRGEDNKPGMFIDSLTWEQIKEKLAKDPNDNDNYLVTPLYERVYTPYPVVTEFVNGYISIVFEEIIQDKLSDLKKEYIICESSKFKTVISENEEKLLYDEYGYTKNYIENFVNNYQPHYVWCAKFNYEGYCVLITTDPTKNKDTLDLPCFQLVFESDVDLSDLDNLIEVKLNK